jgi:hypothetical protein
MTAIYRSKNPKTFDMKPKHERKIVFTGIDLVGASMTHDMDMCKELKDEYESLMIASGYLENAPFLWVGIMFRYGLKHEDAFHYQRIHKKYGDLYIAKELDMRILLKADELDPRILKEFLEIATLDCLIHAGKKYKLPVQALIEKRAMLGTLPTWEYAMDDHPNLVIERYLATKTRH